MSGQTKCCCEVASMIADVYERLLKAEEWNRYQDEKHTECANRLLEAQDYIRELESINTDILATVDQFLRDEGYSDEEVGEFLCPLVIRLKEQPR